MVFDKCSFYEYSRIYKLYFRSRNNSNPTSSSFSYGRNSRCYYPAPEDNSLANTRWMLESFGLAGAETPIIEGTAVTLQFDVNGQADGSGGCNSFGTTYQVQNSTLTVGEITSTLMACADEGVTEQEQVYLQALQSAQSFTQTENNLTIQYDNGQGNLNFSGVDSS
jgi:heat shock protein HslJ